MAEAAGNCRNLKLAVDALAIIFLLIPLVCFIWLNSNYLDGHGNIKPSPSGSKFPMPLVIALVTPQFRVQSLS